MRTARSRRELRPPATKSHSAALGVALVTLVLLGMLGAFVGASHASGRALPPPVIDPHSAEICMNSRISYHGGWTAAGSEQMLADVLDATARAPVTGSTRVIYAATSEGVYIYDAATHSMLLHKAGDWRSDATATFEVGVAAGNMVDAGAAMHLSQLESIALWTGTANQLASCPRASATTYANSHWDPIDPVDIVISFGIRGVPGFTDELVAVSSDGSLPNPDTDGSTYLDDVLAGLAYDSTFSGVDLTAAQISQILWASYGCTDHRAAGSKGGLVCASAVANYYLTRHVYSVSGGAVSRYHNRLPPGTDLNTRDHRIETITAGDVRAALRLAVPDLPAAPHYLIVCVGAAGAWQELEAGYAATGALIGASAIDLQAYWNADLSAAEQAAIRAATGIPAGDIPVVVVSIGRPAAGTFVADGNAPGGLPALHVDPSVTARDGVTLRYGSSFSVGFRLTIRDCAGRVVRRFFAPDQEKGPYAIRWDCRDDHGRLVPSGIYFCSLENGSVAARARVIVVH